MMIDCDTCAVRGPACGDCVVSVMLGGPPAGVDADPPPVDLNDEEQAAIAALAEQGMVPPLRLVPRKAG